MDSVLIEDIDPVPQENNPWEDISGDGGIMKKILVEGTGPLATVGEQVKVHYVGTLTDGGKEFDSSRRRNDYFKFDLGAGRVIKGWDKGVATMKVGEKCILRCREDYAYGKNGSPPSIPGGATLDFEVELFANWDDVEGVPGVTAMTLTPTEDKYMHVKDEASVTFSFALCDSSGSVESSALSMSGVTLELNDEKTFKEWPEWFHKCLSKLKIKEVKVYRVSDVGLLEIPQTWGALNEFHFRVDLMEVKNPKDAFERDTDENVVVATQRKEKGNAYFKAGKYERAVQQYKKGADDLEYEVERKKKPADLKEAFDANFEKLFVTLYANMAMAYLKDKKFDEGIEAAGKALQYDPQHLKAMCRRAQCFAQSGRYAEALPDCEAVLKIDAKNSTAKQVQKYASGKIAQEKKRMKKMASRMFKRKKASKQAEEETKEEEEEVEAMQEEAASKGVSAPYEAPKGIPEVDEDVAAEEAVAPGEAEENAI